MSNTLNIQPDQLASYAYTVFDTSKTSSNYNTVKKCINFKAYTTHKLIINTSSKSHEYTFLRLAYSTPLTQWADTNGYGWTGSDSWTASPSTVDSGRRTLHDVDTIIEGAKCQSIVGNSLMDFIPVIFSNINNSSSFEIDGTVFKRGTSLNEYIHLFLDKIYETDPVLLISLCVCPREYFSVENYNEYIIYFMQIIKTIGDKINNAAYAKKYHLDRSILVQIARIFAATIRSDYLFLFTNVLIHMLNFIVDVRIANNISCEKPLHYDVVNNMNEITIVGSEIKDTNSDEFRFKQMAIHESPTFYNPYELVDLVQYINLKLISENRKPLKFSLQNTIAEKYTFVQRTCSDEEDNSRLKYGYMMNVQWAMNNLADFDDPRPYKTGSRTTVKYEHMSKILTKKQKNIFVNSLMDTIENINLNDDDVILNSSKYSYGVSLIKEMLCSLIGEDNIEKDRTPLDIVINNFHVNEPRSTMLLKIYNSMRDKYKLAMLILSYLTDDEIKDKETFNLINHYVNTDTSFNVNWFNDHKDVLVEALRNRYNLSNKIDNRQLYAFYLFTHCPEFIKKEFVTSVTEALIKGKNTKSNALNAIVDGFFRQKSSAVLAFLDELQSTLMKDLFISIYNLKASQQMFIFMMTDELSKSTEVEAITRNAIKLAEIKAIHYATCEYLLDTAYKSTNSFRGKIVDMLKENAVSTVFSGNKKKINNDARIALFADLLRALSKSFLTVEEQCKIANQYDGSRYEILYPYRIDDMSGVMKAISLVPECTSEITVFFTEKYLQEH